MQQQKSRSRRCGSGFEVYYFGGTKLGGELAYICEFPLGAEEDQHSPADECDRCCFWGLRGAAAAAIWRQGTVAEVCPLHKRSLARGGAEGVPGDRMRNAQPELAARDVECLSVGESQFERAIIQNIIRFSVRVEENGTLSGAGEADINRASSVARSIKSALPTKRLNAERPTASVRAGKYVSTVCRA